MIVTKISLICKLPALLLLYTNTNWWNSAVSNWNKMCSFSPKTILYFPFYKLRQKNVVRDFFWFLWSIKHLFLFLPLVQNKWRRRNKMKPVRRRADVYSYFPHGWVQTNVTLFVSKHVANVYHYFKHGLIQANAEERERKKLIGIEYF